MSSITYDAVARGRNSIVHSTRYSRRRLGFALAFNPGVVLDRRRPRPQYRDIGLASALLASVFAGATGLAAARLGWITVEVKITLGSHGRTPRPTVAASAPPLSTAAPVTAPTAPRLVEVSATVPVTRSAALVSANGEASALSRALPSAAYTAQALPSTSGTSTALAKEEAPPGTGTPALNPRRSGAFASASAAQRRPDCAMYAGVVNVDPTAGDIGGTTGLPDQVTYFKHTKSGCQPARRPASAGPSN